MNKIIGNDKKGGQTKDASRDSDGEAKEEESARENASQLGLHQGAARLEGCASLHEEGHRGLVVVGKVNVATHAATTGLGIVDDVGKFNRNVLEEAVHLGGKGGAVGINDADLPGI